MCGMSNDVIYYNNRWLSSVLKRFMNINKQMVHNLTCSRYPTSNIIIHTYKNDLTCDYVCMFVFNNKIIILAELLE